MRPVVLTSGATVPLIPQATYRTRLERAVLGCVAQVFGQLKHPATHIEPMEMRLHIELPNLPNLNGRQVRVSMGTDAELDPRSPAAKQRVATP